MMGIFGWSLPPGCGRLPGEEPTMCESCGRDADDCECPECPICGDVGCIRHFPVVLLEDPKDTTEPEID